MIPSVNNQNAIRVLGKMIFVKLNEGRGSFTEPWLLGELESLARTYSESRWPSKMALTTPTLRILSDPVGHEIGLRCL